MSEALTIRERAERVFQSMRVEVAPTLEGVAAELGITPAELAEFLNHKDVAQIIHAKTKARAMLAMDACMARLLRMADSEEDKTALAAIALVSKFAGAVKQQPVSVRLNFDELFKQAAAMSTGPLSGITQITESAVIDADEDGDGDDYNDE